MQNRIGEVFGSERFQLDSILYLSKNHILQDLVSKKRAFSVKAKTEKRTPAIDSVDVRRWHAAELKMTKDQKQAVRFSQLD